MDYDKLPPAEKIALAEFALKMRQLHEPHDRQRNYKPLEQLIKETIQTAQKIAKGL